MLVAAEGRKQRHMAAVLCLHQLAQQLAQRYHHSLVVLLFLSRLCSCCCCWLALQLH
jgi:hypothetical protein